MLCFREEKPPGSLLLAGKQSKSMVQGLVLFSRYAFLQVRFTWVKCCIVVGDETILIDKSGVAPPFERIVGYQWQFLSNFRDVLI